MKPNSHPTESLPRSSLGDRRPHEPFSHGRCGSTSKHCRLHACLRAGERETTKSVGRKQVGTLPNLKLLMVSGRNGSTQKAWERKTQMAQTLKQPPPPLSNHPAVHMLSWTSRSTWHQTLLSKSRHDSSIQTIPSSSGYLWAFLDAEYSFFADAIPDRVPINEEQKIGSANLENQKSQDEQDPWRRMVINCRQRIRRRKPSDQ